MLLNVRKLFLTIFLNKFIVNVNCEIFSSIDRLENLAINQDLLIKELKYFANEVKDDYVERYPDINFVSMHKIFNF